nr:unnamed protein product [Callosobruchus chinensis]
MNLERIFNLLRGSAPIQDRNTNSTNSGDLLQKYKFPLSSIQEISKLDKEIRTCPEFKAQLITQLSTIGGTSGTEDGVKVALKIIDFLFRPEVLINYSWTGVSRGVSGEKTSFQVLEGILTVCFDVVLLADSLHTKQKNANIFKERVLKHAKKRSQRKRARLIEDSSINDSRNELDEIDIEPEAVELQADAEFVAVLKREVVE